MAGERILVVDDEAVVREILGRYLQREGYQVIFSGNGREALGSLKSHRPDLILLDILLPEIDGLEVCQELRKHTDIPIIFITSRDDPVDLAVGLGVGGDDYVRKPFDPIEVVARVKAHLRRYRQLRAERIGKVEEQVLEFPGLRIDPINRTVEVNGTPVALTTREFDLLTLLAQNPNRFFSSDQLIGLIWNTSDSADHRSLMVHISRLRRKIEADPANPKYIVTVRGVGYKLAVDPTA